MTNKEIVKVFLKFIDKDIAENPECLETPDSELVKQMHELTASVDFDDIDLDAPFRR